MSLVTKTREQAVAEAKNLIDELLPDWLSGGFHHPILSCLEPEFIRIVENQVETTSGWKMKLETAIQIMNYIQQNENIVGHKFEGHKFLGFDRENGFIKFDCTKINYDQACQMLIAKKRINARQTNLVEA
jgi:hypothetical protein